LAHQHVDKNFVIEGMFSQILEWPETSQSVSFFSSSHIFIFKCFISQVLASAIGFVSHCTCFRKVIEKEEKS